MKELRLKYVVTYNSVVSVDVAAFAEKRDAEIFVSLRIKDMKKVDIRDNEEKGWCYYTIEDRSKATRKNPAGLNIFSSGYYYEEI